MASLPIVMASGDGGWIDKDGDGDYLDDIFGEDEASSGEYTIILGTREHFEETNAEENTAFQIFPGGTWYRAVEKDNSVLGGQYEWKQVASSGPNPKFKNVEADSVNTDVARNGTSTIGLFSDSHYNEVGGRAEIPGASGIKSRWDTIIDNFNAAEVDAVVHVGDLVDRDANDTTTYKNWLSTAVDYLENQGGSSGSGLDAPIHYVIGDHEIEFLGGSDWGAFGYDSRQESYYKTEAGNVDIVILNVCSSDATWSTSHTVEQEQLDWLRETLFEDSTPKHVFMHIPPFEPGTNTDGKDIVTNGDEVLKLIENCPHATVGYYGHMHHDDPWDRLLSQRQGWLHVPDFHELMGDTSYTPHGFTYAGSDGAAFAETSYSGTAENEAWGFSASESRGHTNAPDHVSQLSLSQSSSISDRDINGGHSGIYAKTDGEIYAKPYGPNAAERNITSGATQLIGDGTTVSSGQWTQINIGGVPVDQLGGADASAGTFTAQKDGIYAMTAVLKWDTLPDGAQVECAIYDMTNSDDLTREFAHSGTNDRLSVVTHTTPPLTAGTELSLRAYQATGSSVDVLGASLSTRWSIRLVG